MIMKNVYYVLMMLMWIFGTIGGIGYLCYYGQYHFAVAELAISFMAFFKVREYFNELVK